MRLLDKSLTVKIYKNAKASTVFGSREAAERWMGKPAMGLDGHRPIALLRTVQGAELVNEFLDRLEHGVYN